MDLEVYDERRTAMLKLLEVAAGSAPFAEWAKYAEAMAPRKLEKLDALLKILYVLLEDVLLLSEGASREIRNADIRRELEALAAAFRSVGSGPRCSEPTSCRIWCAATFRRASRWTRWWSNCAGWPGNALRASAVKPASSRHCVLLLQRLGQYGSMFLVERL